MKNIRYAPPLRSNFVYNQRKKSNQPPKAAYMIDHAPKSKKLLEPISETIKKHKASKSLYQSFGNHRISNLDASKRNSGMEDLKPCVTTSLKA